MGSLARPHNKTKTEFIILGIVVLLALLAARYFAIAISTYRGGFEKDDIQTMTVMMPRGLAAAIMAISFGPAFVNKLMPGVGMKGFFADVAFVVILGTAIVTTIGVSIICHYEMKKIKESEKQNA